MAVVSPYTKSKNVRRWYILPGLLLSILMVSCTDDESTRTIEMLNVAVLPDQSEAQLRAKYQPLLDHIKSQTGLESKLMIPVSYKELLQWFNDKKIDMAMFGGVTYVKAHLENNAVPLIMRDVDGQFKSVALVRSRNPANKLQDLEGAILAFGSRLSTTGHLMSRYFFQQNRIIPEEFFSEVRYSGAHDLTAEWVRDGKVEVGISNSGIINEMFLDGRLSTDMVKVIWESPPYADYVWAVQSYVSTRQRTMIRDVFLHLNKNAENKELLQNLGASYFMPVVQDDFSKLEKIVQQMDQRKVIQ